MFGQWRAVIRVTELVVYQHKEDPCPEQPHDDPDHRSLVRLWFRVQRRRTGDIPCQNQRTVLDIYNTIEQHRSQSGVAFEEVKKREYMNESREHMEEELKDLLVVDLAVGCFHGAVVGALLAYPHEHDDVVHTADDKHPPLEVVREHGKCDDAGADGEESPHELSRHTRVAELGLRTLGLP